jgi:hypothetical protein
MRQLAVVALLALVVTVPADAQQGQPRSPVPKPTLPGRACTTAAGVCWAHPSVAPGTPCQCFVASDWVAGVVREWVWSSPSSN